MVREMCDAWGRERETPAASRSMNLPHPVSLTRTPRIASKDSSHCFSAFCMSSLLSTAVGKVLFIFLAWRFPKTCRAFSWADGSLPESIRRPPTLSDSAPSWKRLEEDLLNTSTGNALFQQRREIDKGLGPPHAQSRLRLFDAKDESSAEVRVTLYRDSSAWCPYCQKVWLLLEQKRIPYRIKTVPLNAYGDKPAWYSRLVDGGTLPAIELDGRLHTESLDIMKLLDEEFPSKPLLTGEILETFQEFIELEKRVQQDWFSLVFYPVEGEALETAKEAFLKTMKTVDVELAKRKGPWFGGGEDLSLVDILFIPMMERIEASILYWRNLQLRGTFSNLDLWIQTWEKQPFYMATKSDYFSLCLAIPSQNGPGYFSPDAKDTAARICGMDGAWDLRISAEKLFEAADMSGRKQIAARHEAAFQIIRDREKVCEFCCRAAGEPGKPSFHAELADPYATANLEYAAAVDICLRHVANALVHGVDAAEDLAKQEMEGYCSSTELLEGWESYEDSGHVYFWNEETGDVVWSPPTGELDSCLAYLRDRVGVPRDMSIPAAFQLRAHLNWAIHLLSVPSS